MLEIKLTVLFLVCLTSALIFLLVVINNDYSNKNDRKSFLIVPVAVSSDNIEIIIRNIVFKAYEYYDELYVIFLDYGVSDDTRKIINVLMKNYKDYRIIKYSDEYMQNII